MSPTITSIARVNLCLWSVLWLCGSAPVRGQSLSRTLLEEGIPSLAKAAREKGDPVRGAIWFSQKKLNCVKCHQAGATDLLGPDLNRLGRDVTDEYLVESLLAPSAVIKKGYEAIKVLTEDGTVVIGRLLQEGPERIIIRDNSDRSIQRTLARESIEFMEPSDVSTMPSDLSDQLADRQQFLDLARYLMDLAASSSTDAVAADVSGGGEVSERLKGIALIDQYRCVRCHAGPTGSILPPATGPKLNEVSGRLDPEFLQRFLGDPAHTQPGTMMPNVLASLPDASRDQVTRSVVAFLRSRSDQTFQRTAVDQQAADRGRETFHSVGCVACHSPRDDSGRELLPDSSVPLGDLASKYSVSSLTQFLEKPHEVRPSGRMPDMKLTHWEAVDIANYLAGGPPESEAASSDVAAGLAAAGRTFYFSLGCANCHESDVEASPFKDLASLNADRGCLSADSDRKVRYDFSDQQRRLIRIALEQLADPLGKQAELNLAMHTLRCFNCHQRSGLGGVSSERDLYFHTENENLGPQGRIPPTLTHVGAKLKPKWMRQVLVSGRAIRPYIKTRMPQYGAENVEPISERFQALDELPPIDLVSIGDPKEASKTGTDLVGRNGLNCVACHTFQNKPAQTMPAVDLTEMGERLQRVWFEHYMRAPQTLSPGTVMPSFWPGGKAIRGEILDGDTDLQIATIWHYLQDGRQARQPAGLDIKPIELVAGEEAVMLRRSYPGIGKRGIGVGYPSQVNIAFDAEQLRLAMIWQGKFADPGGVWRGQGSGMVRPLSRDVVRFPAGPDLDQASDPWIVDEGRPPRHQFQGYHLDALRRPTFSYRFDRVEVQDYVVDMIDPASGTAMLKRLLRFETEQPTGELVFRVAAGNRIEKVDDHLYRLNDELLIQVDHRFEASLEQADDATRLLVPLRLKAGVTELEIRYSW